MGTQSVTSNTDIKRWTLVYLSIHAHLMTSNCFSSPFGDLLKSTHIWKLGVWLLDKKWGTLESLAVGKKANLPWFGALNGCGMSPLLVLFSPCFRGNKVVTCKIVSFLCSLDNLLQKNVIVFFFENKISKWRLFEKSAIFNLLFTLFSYQGKVTKIPLAHISLTYIHVFCSPYWLFCLTNFEKNTNLSGMVSLWCDSWCWFSFAPFWNNQ